MHKDSLTQSYIDRYNKLMDEGEFDDANLLKREIELRGYTLVHRFNGDKHTGTQWERKAWA